MTTGSWDRVGKPATVCEGCEKAFSELDDFYSLLFLTAEGLSRKEVCPDCHDQTAPDAFAFWKSSVQALDTNRPRPLDVNFLIDFFQRLTEHVDDERQLQICYIVALILIRKKTLVQLPSGQGESGEILRVRVKKDENETVHEIPVPELTAEKMEIIRDDLGRIFNLGGGGSAPVKDDTQKSPTPPSP